MAASAYAFADCCFLFWLLFKGSPFTCKITGGDELAEAESKKIKVSGKGLVEGRSKLTNEITIDTRSTLIIGGLSVGESQPLCDCL